MLHSPLTQATFAPASTCGRWLQSTGHPPTSGGRSGGPPSGGLPPVPPAPPPPPPPVLPPDWSAGASPGRASVAPGPSGGELVASEATAPSPRVSALEPEPSPGATPPPSGCVRMPLPPQAVASVAQPSASASQLRTPRTSSCFMGSPLESVARDERDVAVDEVERGARIHVDIARAGPGHCEAPAAGRKVVRRRAGTTDREGPHRGAAGGQPGEKRHVLPADPNDATVGRGRQHAELPVDDRAHPLQPPAGVELQDECAAVRA